MKNVEGILGVIEKSKLYNSYKDLLDAEIGVEPECFLISELAKSIQFYYENLLPTEEDILRIIGGFSYPSVMGLPAIDANQFIDIAKSIRSEMEQKIKGEDEK
jgi:hypothetical protein